MKDSFPRLADPALLPKSVLCIAPHPDDEVLGCGGMLAWHAARGDRVRVVILSDGSQGASNGHPRGASLAAEREAESKRAAAVLGYSDVVFLRMPDGALGAQSDLVARVKTEIERSGAELVYAPSPFEHHPDHRAAAGAIASAAGALATSTRAIATSTRAIATSTGPIASAGAARAGVRVHLYGVNEHVPANVLFDTTASFARKKDALACFVTQSEGHDLVAKAEAADHARTINVPDPKVRYAEGFVELGGHELLAFHAAASELLARTRGVRKETSGAPTGTPARTDLPATTAVVSTWNKKDDLRANLDGLRSQTLPFASIVVVDNASTDGTAAMVEREFPDVRLIVMPHSKYGACETFNIGFSSSLTELTAILDDDIVMPPDWLEKATLRMAREPKTTAIVSTQVIEPGMPESYKTSALVNTERYMSTFRGCASLARTQALREAEYYDERLFIYGNERDLTCRLLNLGYRVLQYPEASVFHKTPFGIKMGKRSLYYHARNAWLSMLKYAPLADLLRMPWLVFSQVVLRGSKKEAEGSVSDAVGTIGIGKSLKETPGAWWVVMRAGLSVLANVPYCLKHRKPCRAPDFELPIS